MLRPQQPPIRRFHKQLHFANVQPLFCRAQRNPLAAFRVRHAGQRFRDALRQLLLLQDVPRPVIQRGDSLQGQYMCGAVARLLGNGSARHAKISSQAIRRFRPVEVSHRAGAQGSEDFARAGHVRYVLGLHPRRNLPPPQHPARHQPPIALHDDISLRRRAHQNRLAQPFACH